MWLRAIRSPSLGLQPIAIVYERQESAASVAGTQPMSVPTPANADWCGRLGHVTRASQRHEPCLLAQEPALSPCFPAQAMLAEERKKKLVPTYNYGAAFTGFPALSGCWGRGEKPIWCLSLGWR